MSTLLHQVADPGFFFIAAKRAKTEDEGIFLSLDPPLSYFRLGL